MTRRTRYCTHVDGETMSRKTYDGRGSEGSEVWKCDREEGGEIGASRGGFYKGISTANHSILDTGFPVRI